MSRTYKNLPGTKRDDVPPERTSFGRREGFDAEKQRSFSVGHLAALIFVVAIGAYIVAELADFI